MFNAEKLIEAYKDLIGWKPHFDLTDITIPADLLESTSKEYFQQKHPALRLDIIRATIPSGYTLETYLRDKMTDASVEVFNDIIAYKQANSFGKTLLDNAVLLNKRGWQNDAIVNQGRFVGFQIRLNAANALRMVIKEIGTQFKAAEDFELYLFHSSLEDPITQIRVQPTGAASWTWTATEQILNAFETEKYHGGVFILGYYQNDLNAEAINYSNLDWNKGECSSCGGNYGLMWNRIAEYYHIYPLYVPAGDFTVGKMFDYEKAIFSRYESFGLNLKLSVECDLTQFFIDNKMQFKNLYALKVTHKILYDMKFSQQTNHIEEDIRNLVIRDLEGDKETNYHNLATQYKIAMKAVQFNTSGISSACLPCEDEGTAPIYGSL